ncbi:hypothetical protein TNCV_597541 [Trichonephila clavipes]|nr:hypothetical protein TNCV_597541 [Trichonephila clavipes]
MSGRKYKSVKRKLLLNREKEKIKCVKILTLITTEQSNKNITNTDTLTSERERNLSKENGETQQANTNDKNMQDLDNQQPSEKDIVQPEDVSNAPTEKCEGRKIQSRYVPFRTQVLYRLRQNNSLRGMFDTSFI